MNTIVKANWNTPLVREFRSGFKKSDLTHVPLTPESCGSRYQLEKNTLKAAIENKSAKVLLQWGYRYPNGELGRSLYDIFVEDFCSTKEQKDQILAYLYTPQGDLIDFLRAYHDSYRDTYVSIDGVNHKVHSIVSMESSLIVGYDGGSIVINQSEISYVDAEDIGFGEGNYIVIDA